jgi:Tol biopolymer transport system component
MKVLRAAAALALSVGLTGCADGDGPTRSPTATSTARTASPAPTASATPIPSRVVHTGSGPYVVGDAISIDDLSGRIVFDDFEDVFAMDVDGSNVVKVAAAPGAEFDAAWSPDGESIVYRDSTRGINDDDEIFVASADGSERRNLTNDPGNDWGPDWSPDGTTIAFNSDRDGGQLRGYLVDPDGENLRALGVEGWFEYPSFSPDGTKLVFMGHQGTDYEIFVADVESGATEQLTDSRGNDGWPVWSPDGGTIAFTSERDDCAVRRANEECWQAEPDDRHRDVWLMDADGADPRRVSPEIGQFVAWSPDSRYLLVSGRALYIVRPDGSGRLELRADGIDRSLGGIPDWR